MYCKFCGEQIPNDSSYCNHCGKAQSIASNLYQPGSQSFKKELFEEAVLSIKSCGNEDVASKLFQEDFGLFDRIGFWLAKTKVTWNWQKIDILNFELRATHPTKDKYIVYTSPKFHAFCNFHEDFFPPGLQGSLMNTVEGREWLESFFSKRRVAWESVNKYLLQEGWSAITEKARLRLPPIGINFDVMPLDELKALPAKERAYLSL